MMKPGNLDSRSLFISRHFNVFVQSFELKVPVFLPFAIVTCYPFFELDLYGESRNRRSGENTKLLPQFEKRALHAHTKLADGSHNRVGFFGTSEPKSIITSVVYWDAATVVCYSELTRFY